MGAFVRPPESTRTRRSNKPRESARGRQQPRASLERRISAHRRHGGVVTDRIERPDAKSAPSGAHATCEVARRDGLAADVDRTSRSSSKVGMFGRLQTTPSHSHIRPRIALEGMTRICESISRTRAHDSSDIGGCQLSPGLTVLPWRPQVCVTMAVPFGGRAFLTRPHTQPPPLMGFRHCLHVFGFPLPFASLPLLPSWFFGRARRRWRTKWSRPRQVRPVE